MSAQVVGHVDGRVVIFAIPEGGAFLGREPEFAVCLPLEGVSRVHAKIAFDGTGYIVEDLKSTNGTFVNGEAVQRERLHHLDVVSLGRAAQLVFLLASSESASATRTGITRATLVSSDADAAPYEIAPGEITMGRAPTCNVVVDNTAVSSLHLRIQHTGDALILVDLASSNGTLVNGARVFTATLNDGDVISLGGVETFKVSIARGTVQGAAMAPAPAAAAAVVEVEAPQNWKTRLEWSPVELMQIAAAKEEALAFAAVAAASKGSTDPPKSAHKCAAAAKAPVKPAAAAPAKAASPPSKADAAPRAPQSPPPSPAKTAPTAPTPAAPTPSAAPTPPQPERAAAPTPPKPTPPKPERIVEGVSGEMPTPTGPATLPRIPQPEVSEAPGQGRASPIHRARFEASGYSFEMTSPGEYAVGRSADAHLTLTSPMVSRKHARLVLSADRTSLECHDLGGANSTMVNGRKGEHFLLADGDEILLGDVRLRVALER